MGEMSTRFGVAWMPGHLGATKKEEKAASKSLADGRKGEGWGTGKARRDTWCGQDALALGLRWLLLLRREHGAALG
uniref:Uncharacterized protein n=1 Tax=Calidris pygmaea TaxID=425635 RepID=A0A8C3PGP2_9CHAR